jgi:hypothetical protein
METCEHLLRQCKVKGVPEEPEFFLIETEEQPFTCGISGKPCINFGGETCLLEEIDPSVGPVEAELLPAGIISHSEKPLEQFIS